VDLSPNLPLEEQQHREVAIEVDCGELAAEAKAAEHAGVGLLASPSCRAYREWDVLQSDVEERLIFLK